MEMTTVNSDFYPPFAVSMTNRQKSNKNQYQNFGTQIPSFCQDWNQTLQGHNPHPDLDFRETDLEREDEKNLILQNEEKHEKSPEFPKREKRDEIKPNRDVPEEDDDLKDDDDAIIEEPTRELDDSYRPGHADRENIPPIEEDVPNTNPRKNSKS